MWPRVNDARVTLEIPGAGVITSGLVTSVLTVYRAITADAHRYTPFSHHRRVTLTLKVTRRTFGDIHPAAVTRRLVTSVLAVGETVAPVGIGDTVAEERPSGEDAGRAGFLAGGARVVTGFLVRAVLTIFLTVTLPLCQDT